MSHDTVINAKTNRSTAKTQTSKQNSWKSDDVHRLAQRSPSLYQTRLVPQVKFGLNVRQFGGHGGMS